MEKKRKRVPVRTRTTDEDDTLRLAHLLKDIARRSSHNWSMALVRRAFAFNGCPVSVRDADVVPRP